jgi:predicted nucleotide-binding protein
MKRQRIVNGNEAVAGALADAGTLVSFAGGAELIAQGAFDQHAYFLLAGKVELRIYGKLLPYGREGGEVIGEFSAINPELPRTATVIAAEQVVALQVSGAALEAAAKAVPEVWRLLAVDLTRKVEQRNQLINSCNERPVVFMIASSERAEIAEELRLALSTDFDVFLWSDDDLFPPGSYQLESLNERAAFADFAVVLAEPDDLRRDRARTGGGGQSILFELGYLMSVLGRHRTLLLVPEGGCDAARNEFKGLKPWCFPVPDGTIPSKVVLSPTIRALRNYFIDRKVRSKLGADD